MTAISKNEYIDKLDDIVKYNNTHQRTIKMKSVDVESNDKSPKLKVADHVKISKGKNIFAKYYTRY